MFLLPTAKGMAPGDYVSHNQGGGVEFDSLIDRTVWQVVTVSVA